MHVSVEFAFKNVFNCEREVIYCKFDSGYHGCNDLRLEQQTTIKQIRYLNLKCRELTWYFRGKVLLPLSGVYISNVHYDRMSQLRTMVLGICVKWCVMCIITIIGAPLVVTRHREFSFFDYHDENGHSIVDFRNMWLLKPQTRNTTWFKQVWLSLNMSSTQKYLTFWASRKRSRFMKSVGYLDFNAFFGEVVVNQIGSYSKQRECDMIYQLSLSRSFFPTNLYCYCWSYSLWNVA